MDPLPHKFPAAIKSQKKKTTLTACYGGFSEPRPKATVHSFFPIQTFEAQIQMLPLIRITEQQKQTKSTYWPRTKHTIRLQMCSVFSSWVLGRNRSAHKGFIRRINRYTEGTAASRRFTPEVVSLAAFTRRRRVEPVTVGLRHLLLRPFQVQAAGSHLGPFRQRGLHQGPWFTHGNWMHLLATAGKKFTAFKK